VIHAKSKLYCYPIYCIGSYKTILQKGKTHSIINSRDAYQKKAEAQLRELEAKIAVLKARAEKMAAEAQINYNQRIKDLMREYDQAMEQFSEMKDAGQDAWQTLQSGLDKSINDLTSTVESAVNRLKE